MTNNDKANHLKGQLGPPLVTKNDHFLKLCHEGQLGPPLVTKNDHFLKLCHEGQLDHPVSTFSVAILGPPPIGRHRT